jgi:hypothetical protein
VIEASEGKSVWIDMESSLRSITLSKIPGENNVLEKDEFSISKCFECILAGVSMGLPVSRFTLLSI